MRLRKIGPITTRSRVRDLIPCAFIPHSVGANSAQAKNETTKSCYCLKATTKITPTLEKKNAPMVRSLNI